MKAPFFFKKKGRDLPRAPKPILAPKLQSGGKWSEEKREHLDLFSFLQPYFLWFGRIFVHHRKNPSPLTSMPNEMIFLLAVHLSHHE